MRGNYGPTFGERTTCFLCDFWWLILIILVFLISGGLVARYYLGQNPVPTAAPGEQVLGTGDVQVTLRWNNINDLDLWVVDPSGEKIYFYHPRSASHGELDVDTNLDCQRNITDNGVENIYWPVNQSPKGTFTVYVNLFKTCDSSIVSSDFSVTVLIKGKEQIYTGTVTPGNNTVMVTEFEND